MAQTGRSTELDPEFGTLGEMRPTTETQFRVQTSLDLGPRAVQLGASHRAQGIRDVLDAAQEFLDGTLRRARAVGVRSQDRFRQVKDKHPIELLGALAGTAFVLGMLARIWRSRRYE